MLRNILNENATEADNIYDTSAFYSSPTYTFAKAASSSKKKAASSSSVKKTSATSSSVK